MALKRALKIESKLRMAIVGPAGSGKTFTALKLAQGLAQGRPIALFDTEHGSAAKYADDFTFDVDNIAAPFHPNKFGEAIREAVAGGYGVVVIDSLSHAWNGPGGLLTLVEEFTAKQPSKNSYTAWKDATPIQDRLVQAVVSADIHVIVTMRSKTDYIIEQGTNGRSAPRKVGMAPIQRDGMDYEFDVVMEMNADNTGIVTKSRCSALNGGVFTKPGQNVTDVLNEWLQGSRADAPNVEQPPVVSQDGPVEQKAEKSPAFRRFMAEGTKTFNKDWENARHWLIEQYCKKSTPASVRTSANDLSDDELDIVADTMVKNRVLVQDLFAKQPVATGK